MPRCFSCGRQRFEGRASAVSAATETAMVRRAAGEQRAIIPISAISHSCTGTDPCGLHTQVQIWSQQCECTTYSAAWCGLVLIYLCMNDMGTLLWKRLACCTTACKLWRKVSGWGMNEL